uniref:DDE-1 domain-containing protein n=1 Tax=Pelodiscus sinensis TaxID=13735 RepID=K7G1K5_PELSI
KSYTSGFKLSVLTYAKENGIRAAGRKFSVNKKSVREWRKEEAEIEKLHPRKRAYQGKKAKWPKLEENLVKWVLAQRQRQRAVKLKARLFAAEMKINYFKGGSEITFQSMHGHLPDEWEKKMDDFKYFVHKEINQLGLKPNNIINMDEVPMSFNRPTTRSVAATGVKTIGIATTGHECTCFTVVLACTAGGEKLKPMVIFKRVMMPREKLPAGVSVICNKKEWMNTEVMKTWTDSCFCASKGSFFNSKPLLILDALAAHKETSVQKHINAVRAQLAVIPGGLTCKLQPFDVAVNHPFKCFFREEWDNWMTNREHTFTPAGQLRCATYVDVCKWVLAAWERITPAIGNGFRKCEILPEVDSSSSECNSDAAPQTSTVTEAH